MSEATAEYITAEVREQKYNSYDLSLPEWHLILRLRQLFNSGCDIIIVEKRNGSKPKVREVKS